MHQNNNKYRFMPTNIPLSDYSLTSPNNTSRKWTSLLVVAALIASSLLSSVVVLNPHYFEKQSGWLTGEKILICTSAGLRWVSVSALERKNKHQHSDDHQNYNSHCPTFKLHDSRSLSFNGSYTLVHDIQFVVHLADYQSQQKQITDRLYLIAPKHSPPLS
ncbi:hypothetical protein ACQKPX_12630 [Photobacterium sp. DNB23_23_1]|uniref:Uncharacterized protein n=1 Tax=Photobacterium pectinilyticum TaxID=2906793 RepID=A0ABT1N346_9GAMM|nr:hypothetical protein [Photobacterium sp. ZSDE20]MCQ1059168.1 hypothetical protein [Photobacterium sp. ZSDE20]MDD1824820.1 hypothetical protein [Photobacterium sp. ZSDE20]